MGENGLDIWISPMKNGVLTTFHPKIPKQIGMSKAERWREGSNPFLNLSLSALVMQVESFWNDFIMAAQKSRGDWPSLRKRSQAMADAWDLSEAVQLNAIERTKIRYFLGSMSIYELELVGNFRIQRFSTSVSNSMGFSNYIFSDVLTISPTITDQFSSGRFDVFFLGQKIPSHPTMIRALSTWPTIEQYRTEMSFIVLLIGVASHCMVGEAHRLPDDVFSLMAHSMLELPITDDFTTFYN